MAYYKMVDNRLVRVYKHELNMANPMADDYAAVEAYPKMVTQMPIIATHGKYSHIGFGLYQGKWIYQWEYSNGDALSEAEQNLEAVKTLIKNQDAAALSAMSFDDKDALIANLLTIVKSLI